MDADVAVGANLEAAAGVQPNSVVLGFSPGPSSSSTLRMPSPDHRAGTAEASPWQASAEAMSEWVAH
jgi:hypothetical protein